MTAKEFLLTKDVEDQPVKGMMISELMEEYYLSKSGMKIDLDRKFENLTEKYEKAKNGE